MWRSKARSLLLLRRCSRPPSIGPPKSVNLNLISPPIQSLPGDIFYKPLAVRSLSSSTGEAQAHDYHDNECASSNNLEENCEEETAAVEGNDDEAEEEIDSEKLERVISLLQHGEIDDLEAKLQSMEILVSEDFVVRVMQGGRISGKNLILFYKWALNNGDESVKSARAIEVLIFSMAGLSELDKKEAYLLWDLVKDLGEEEGLLRTEVLNELVSVFARLGKGKAALEVFNKYEDFGCDPDGDSYYFTIESLGNRKMFDAAWTVCEKMINSGRVPDKEKIGKIIKLFCKAKMAKEAHLVYMTAKVNDVYQLRSSLDSLIKSLSKNDETIRSALELLNDYQGESYKYSNRTFSLVVKGLCKIKDVVEAKKLLMRMVDSGPPPGSSAFNPVITALSKGGDMEEAVALMRIMEKRGLRPDVYTYSVIMSGYAKVGFMDEARKIFDEAKKNHAKLCPVTYHILTRGYCKMEEFDKALECLKEMKDDGVQPNTDEYNKMIQTLCIKDMDWRTAAKLRDEMKENNVYLPGITRSLISAVKELEENEVQSLEAKTEA